MLLFQRSVSRCLAASALLGVLPAVIGCGSSVSDGDNTAPGGSSSAGQTAAVAGGGSGATSAGGSGSISSGSSGSSGAGEAATAGAGDAGGADAGGASAGGAAAGGTAGGAATAGSGGAGAGGGSSAGSTGSEVVAPTGGKCGTAWINPSKQGIHDPSVAKDGSTYYVYGTGRSVSFSTSTDKINWVRGGNAMAAIPSWANSLGLSDAPDIWAPDVHQVGNKFFLYYSVSAWGDVTHSAIGLMTNTTLNPTGAGYQWVDQGKVVGSPEGGSGVNVIDPDMMMDDDGTAWLVYGSFHKGIRLVQLNPQTGLALNSPPKPVTLTSSLGEGASLIKANGYYYLFVSRGKCCAGLSSTYEVVYGRSSKVTGPYVNRNGADMNGGYEKLLAAGQDGNPGQGGQSFFKENGQWYIDYHAYAPPSGGSVLNVRPVYFDDSGWPTFDVCKAKGYKP